jgi:hypothetical protein
MGLVLAIFCFIIGIPMFLVGLGLIGSGGQNFHEIGKFEGHIDVWRNNTMPKNALICDRIFSETGGYSDEYNPVNTRDACIDNRTDRDYSSKLYDMERLRNQGTPKVIGGGLLMMFAFLLMWGGNRTRRPKEVREVQPTQPNKDTNQEVESIADELSKLAKLKEQGVITEDEFSRMKNNLMKRT